MTSEQRPEIEAVLRDASAMRRFAEQVDRSGVCHVWTGGLANGYGRLAVGRSDVLAHRLAWVLEKGPIPEGLFVLHRCNNRGCVNVAHLYLGRHHENALDAVAAGTLRSPWTDRTKCLHGHPYTPENTKIRQYSGKNRAVCIRRVCIKCQRRRALESWRRRHPPVRAHIDLEERYGV